RRVQGLSAQSHMVAAGSGKYMDLISRIINAIHDAILIAAIIVFLALAVWLGVRIIDWVSAI
ncbi:MAG: hypothetical protein ACE5FJ_06985, partial [Gemmatimonadales bacterium]